MRIAMFMPSLGPEELGWRVHLDFAAAVERLGHQFDLLTTPRRSVATPAAAPPAAGNSQTVATVLEAPSNSAMWATAAMPLLRTRQLIPATRALTRHLARHGDSIDLLHVEVAYPHGAAAALAARRSGWGGPIAVTPMGEDILTVADRAYGMCRYPAPATLVRHTLRQAAAIRCISPLAERRVAKLARNSRRRVIPLNVADDIVRSAELDAPSRTKMRADARAAIDAELGTAGRPLVLSFGRLHPFKGIDYLIEAAAAIGDATVLIVGPSMNVRPFGEMATYLGNMATELGVDDKVRIVGSIHPSRAPEILAAADALVVSSPLESLNKVCMEAAAVGTPFVVTETTGISAWVPDDGVGIVVPPRSAATIAWAIEEILGGHFAYDHRAAAGFAGLFSSDRIAADVVAFYEDTVAAL